MTLKLNTVSILIGLTLVLTFSGCVTTSVAKLQRTSEKEVEVFTTKLPTREYIEIMYIQADGSTLSRPEKLLTRLTERAKKEGADAVINVKYDFQWSLPIVSGTAIKYIDNQN